MKRTNDALIYHKPVLLTYCFCGQDICACAWRWDSGPSSRSGWDEPGPYQRPWGCLLWKSLWTQRQNQLSILLQPHHVWDWGGAQTHKKKDTSAFISHLMKIPDLTRLSSFLVLDGDSGRPRGDASVSSAVCCSVSVCCGHQPAAGLHPPAQQTGLPERLQQVRPSSHYPGIPRVG